MPFEVGYERYHKCIYFGKSMSTCIVADMWLFKIYSIFLTSRSKTPYVSTARDLSGPIKCIDRGGWLAIRLLKEYLLFQGWGVTIHECKLVQACPEYLFYPEFKTAKAPACLKGDTVKVHSQLIKKHKAWPSKCYIRSFPKLEVPLICNIDLQTI